MMAFERTPGPQTLEPGTVAELRSALARSITSGDHGEEIKTLLTRAAAEARRNGAQAEQLLIALKDIWYSIPSVGSQSESEIQMRLLQQLIARCIQEYYAG